MPKRTFGERVNTWLAEPPGAEFTSNKWRFWYLTLCGFQLLNSALTALVFGAGGQLQNAMGAVVLAVGGLLAWLGIAFLHYSDSSDRQLAYRVSVLDSITLVCILCHFAFLAWTFGHLKTIQGAESKYEAQATTYNQRAEKISADNTKIAEAAQTIARENTKRAKLENDTTYQQRRIIEAGGLPRASMTKTQIGDGPALSTAPIELEKPQRPGESSAEFLSRWDSTIRLANLAELILAACTLIYIRVRSSKTNAPGPAMDFSPLLSVASRTPVPRPALATKTTTPDDIVDDTRNQQKTTQGVKHPGLRVLRECLKAIAFINPPGHFKVDIKDDYLIIRFMESRRGDESTKYSVRVRLGILDDALSVPAEAFKLRVERLLKQNGFFEDREED